MSFDRSACRPNSCVPCRARLRPNPPPSSAAPSRPCSQGATCSRPPRPAPARRRRFALPLLQRLRCENPHPRGPRAPRALVLVPTRELAAQVGESFVRLRPHLEQRTVLIFGGVSPRPQVDALRARRATSSSRRPVACSITSTSATSTCRASRYLVLDEADRMLDMGFIRDIRRILALLPPKRQNLLFSATFSDEIRELATRSAARSADGRGRAAQRAGRARRRTACTSSTRAQKRARAEPPAARPATRTQALVFTRTKHGANRLAEQLERDGIQRRRDPRQQVAEARARGRSTDFKAYKVQVLVATDIAARGIDIDGAAARRQLRPAARAGGLRAPHRPHRPRGLRRARRCRWSRR